MGTPKAVAMAMRSSALKFLTRLASDDRSAVDTTDLPQPIRSPSSSWVRPAAFLKYAMLRATIELTVTRRTGRSACWPWVRPPDGFSSSTPATLPLSSPQIQNFSVQSANSLLSQPGRTHTGRKFAIRRTLLQVRALRTAMLRAGTHESARDVSRRTAVLAGLSRPDHRRQGVRYRQDEVVRTRAARTVPGEGHFRGREVPG